MIRQLIKNSALYLPAKYITGKCLYHLPVMYRYGKVFTDTWQFLTESEFWTEEQIANYQLDKLKKLIAHAYNNVPYYKELFNSIGFHPNDFKDFSDLKNIPYLTKDLINEHREKLVDQRFPKKHMGYGTTGGSTGVPMGFYFDKRIRTSKEWAFITDLWRRIQYANGDKCIVLRGNVVNKIIKNKKYWKTNWSNNYLIMSSYHMTEETLPLYVEQISTFQPKYIQAFPSSLQILASFMRDNNIKPFESIQGIICASENIYEWQRELFNEVFKTRTFSFYGHSERVCLAGECEHSTYYHNTPQYGFMELINDKNKWCTEENERGEIVATGFGNYVMPFIRYKTQDIAINTNSKCSCGRNWKLIKSVEGRLQDYVIGKNNERITLTALIFAQHFICFGKMKNMQLFQNKIGLVEVRIVEKTRINSEDIAEVKNKMIKASDGALMIDVKIVDSIPRTKSGKYRFLIQELPMEFSDQ